METATGDCSQEGTMSNPILLKKVGDFDPTPTS